MSEFDPYLKWLGIRDATRPVNYYRLLGLELYESDKDVISMSADRQMAHIRTFQSGPNGKLSQQILNELARARRCLLVDEKKAAYDQQLGATLASPSGLAGAQGTEVPTVSVQVVPDVASAPTASPTVADASVVNLDSPVQASSGMNLNVRTDPNARQKKKKRERNQLIWGLISWLSGGLAAVGVGAYLISSGILGIGGEAEEAKSGKAKTGNVKTGKVENATGGSGKTIADPSSVVVKNPETEKPRDGVAAIGESETNSTDPNSSTAKPEVGLREKTTPEVPSLENQMVWTLDDVAKYPKPTWAEEQLLKRVATDLSRDRFGRLESSAPSTPGTKEVTQKVYGLKQPGLLIGFSYVLDSDFKIKRLHPVFRTRNSISRGNLRNSESLLAKPGYAVGEVQVSKLSPMNCIRLRFMRVRPQGLDPDASYLSSWIGKKSGPLKTIANPLQAPIVGTYCDVDRATVVRTLGLIAAHSSLKSTKPKLKPKVAASVKEKSDKPTISSPRETNPDIVGRSLPVISRSPVPSTIFTSGKRGESIVFVNKLDGLASVYQIDAKSNLRSYYSIRPGDSRTATSELGMNWYVKKGATGIATYRAELGKNTAIIDGRDPDVSSSFGLPETAGPEKKPIPSSSDRSKATKEFKSVYGELIAKLAAGDARDNRSNVESMIQDARDSDEDLALQFVMLEAAKDMAIGTGDCRTAMLAVQELERRFEDFDYWEESLGAVMGSGKSLSRTGDKFLAADLETVLRFLIDEAIRKGESRTAGKLVAFGIEAASRNGDAKAGQFYVAKGKESSEVARLHKQYETALKKLARDPDNATANEQKGRYLIVVQNDFDGALECWKMSDDDEYLDIVKDEAKPGANASFLARRWQNLGRDPRTAFGRRCYQRAIEVLQAGGKAREAIELRKLLD